MGFLGIYIGEPDDQKPKPSDLVWHDADLVGYLPPAPFLSTETDQQVVNFDYQFDRALSDYDEELPLPPPPITRQFEYDNDVENQYFQPPWQFDKAVADYDEELPIPTPPITRIFQWDNDVENQFVLPLYQLDRDIVDASVELIQFGKGVIKGWDTDAENQLLISSFEYKFDKDFSDLVSWPIPPNPPAQAQVYTKPASCVNISFPWGFKVKRACKGLADEEVLYILPPPPAPTMAQDSDAENQFLQLPWIPDYFDERAIQFLRTIPICIFAGGNVLPTNFGTGASTPLYSATGNIESTSGSGSATPTTSAKGSVQPLIDANGKICP